VSEETSFRDLRDGDTYVPPLRKYPFFLANRFADTPPSQLTELLRGDAFLPSTRLRSPPRAKTHKDVSVLGCRVYAQQGICSSEDAPRSDDPIASRDILPRFFPSTLSARRFNANREFDESSAFRIRDFPRSLKLPRLSRLPSPVLAAAFLYSAIFKFTPNYSRMLVTESLVRDRVRINARGFHPTIAKRCSTALSRA
jgi:hypothetical protein